MGGQEGMLEQLLPGVDAAAFCVRVFRPFLWAKVTSGGLLASEELEGGIFLRTHVDTFFMVEEVAEQAAGRKVPRPGGKLGRKMVWCLEEDLEAAEKLHVR